MERMDFGHVTAAPLQSVFDSARQFGLADAEVLETFDDALRIVGDDATMSKYLEELTAALARRILANEQYCR
jgi:hypothetical protein